MHDVLTYEQRRHWERLDQYAYGWADGEQAAINGLHPRECPYKWQQGNNTLRRRWFEGYVMAHEHGRVDRRYDSMSRRAEIMRRVEDLDTRFPPLSYMAVTAARWWSWQATNVLKRMKGRLSGAY